MPGVKSRGAIRKSIKGGLHAFIALVLAGMLLMSMSVPVTAFGADDDANEEQAPAAAGSVPSSSASSPDARPSVLLVDASLGDLDDFRDYWLGNTFEIVAQDDELVLMTAASPLWWSGGDAPEVSSTAVEDSGETPDTTQSAERTGNDNAPPTYLLGSEAGKPLTSESIAWALDSIAELAIKREQQSKTVIVAAGATGLQARIYAQDLGSIRQSDRADLVGLVFLGTPHSGYSVAADYSTLEIWETLAASAGFEAQDLAPQSDFLTKLNDTPMPGVVQLLQIQGQASNFGFGTTDAATVISDMSWPEVSAQQLSTAKVSATISRGIGLAQHWGPATHENTYGARALDANAVLRLPNYVSYFTSPEVMKEVRQFYEARFPQSTPVTHVSSVLVLDTSGSMHEVLEDGGTKKDAAISASLLYLQAVDFRSTHPFAVPEDVTVVTFNHEVATVTTSYDDAALKAVEGIDVPFYANTDIGLGLQTALAAMANKPLNAEQQILLLSDGISTVGMNNSEILSGPVAEAARRGVVIDVVALGNMEQLDVDFLQQVASATGGVLYQNRDIYGLMVSFLSSRYTSLGLQTLEAEVEPGATVLTELGTLEENMRSFEIGVLSEGELPPWKLLLDGEEVEVIADSNNDSTYGFLSINLDSPAAGSYAIEMKEVAGRVHVFAVGQMGVAERVSGGVQAVDNSLLFLAGAGALLLLLVIIVTANGLAQGKKKKQAALAAQDLQSKV
ncbi:MAG: VWA domain-containing protein [Coriobacteriia bacterium]|nr:VWA domain-containing protein [Coriobacteriia bacterium]